MKKSIIIRHILLIKQAVVREKTSFPVVHHLFFFFRCKSQPSSNKPIRKLPVPGNSDDFVEAVFRPENFRIFSDDFRCFSAGSGDFPASFRQDLVGGIIDLGRNAIVVVSTKLTDFPNILYGILCKTLPVTPTINVNTDKNIVGK